MVRRIEFSFPGREMCSNAGPGWTGETRQGTHGGTNASIFTQPELSQADIVRQGKFQLEVLPEVGHYLHEVSAFVTIAHLG